MELLTKDYLNRILKKSETLLVSKFYDKDRKALFIKDKKFEDVINIDYELNTYDIIFDNCEFERDLIFKERATVEISITFQDCKFFCEALFLGGNFSKPITFNNCKVPNSSISFKGGDFKSIRIDRGDVCRLEFFKGNFKEINVGAYGHEMFIDEIFINYTQVVGKIDFFRTVSFKFDVRGILNSESFLSISECLIQNFIICEFTNNGRLRLSRLFCNFDKLKIYYYEEFKDILIRFKERFNKISPTFFIENSVLNKSELFSIDFSDYTLVSIRESSLVDIIISNITWPKKILYLPVPNSENLKSLNPKAVKSKSDFKLIRENYRQIKYACSKQGDYIGEQYFHGLEMNAYNNSLSCKKDFWTKAILKFSHCTSNYGQSLLLPIVWITVFNGLLFWLMYISGGTKFSSYDFSNSSNYFDTIGEFLRLVNPLHKNDPELKGISLCLDIILRISSSYFLYNIIRATRRFIK